MAYNSPKEQPLIEALAAMFPDSSKRTLRSWLKAERVAIDGMVEKFGSAPVKKGQIISLSDKKKRLEEEVEILYDDGAIVAINKPEGLLSVASESETRRTAHAVLKRHFRPRRVHVVHRLDRETSGVMLFALNEKTRDELKTIFEKHAITRKYAAIVEGRPSPKEGSWRSYLVEDANYYVHETEDKNRGELAISHYKTMGRSKKLSLLEVTLETGKKNQIRVHCQSAGHPVVGDAKYGSKSNPVKRLCLHAHTLYLTHPETGKKLRFHAPIPQPFNQLVVCTKTKSG